MLNFKDGKLSEEELQYVVAGVERGFSKEMLGKLDKAELIELRGILQRQKQGEMSLNDLEQVKAGVPVSYEDAKQDFEKSTGMGTR